MNRKIFLKILLGIAALVVLIKVVTITFVEPWVGKEIQAAVNERNKDFIIEIGKVHISVFTRGIELENITLRSKKGQEGAGNLEGKIESLKFRGVHLLKAIFKKDVSINEVIISNCSVGGVISFVREAGPPVISPLNIRIGKLVFDKINVALKDDSSAQAYSVKEGALRVYDLQAGKDDTLSAGMLKRFDFEAGEFLSVSSDSMYVLKATGINYSAASGILALSGFSINPGYAGYDFTGRSQFQTDRIEAVLGNIHAYDFSAADYLRSGNLISSFVEIGKMDVYVFRDKRKEFRHVDKPAFQDMIYNYPAAVRIDSISLVNGNVTYTEHAAGANEPGTVSINEIHAVLCKVTNDTIYKTENAFLELKGEALLMGKGRMTVFLTARIFDPENTFSLTGTLSRMDAQELNPILEKNAFIYATSGRIDSMDYTFTANNKEATGKLTMLYRGLDIAVKNKRTDDTTAFKERFISLIANKKVMNANPVAGEAVREGVVGYERDPEKFLFNYCFKSILSGMKFSLAKASKKERIS